MIGLGTRTNPYLVSTEEDLNNIRLNPDAHYKLTNDIRLTLFQAGEGWAPIPKFTGSIDGSNYTIYDLYINRPNEPVGFIRNLVDEVEVGSTVVIKNLNFKDVNIVGGDGTGALASSAKGYAHEYITNNGKNRSLVSPVEVRGCTVQGVVRSASHNVGGLVGNILSDVVPTDWNDSEMVNLRVDKVHVDVEINAFGSNIGGLVGNAERGAVDVSQVSTRGRITNGNESVGGIIGRSVGGRGSVRDSYSLMNIQASRRVGGIIGYIAQGVKQLYRFDRNYFAGTLDVPSNSTVHAGPGNGYWQGIHNGESSDMKVLYDETKAQLTSSKFNRVSIKDRYATALTTTQMQDVRIFVGEGYDIFNVWYANESTKNDYLHLKNEFSGDSFTMLGKGTKEEPFQIRSVDNLMAISSYDLQNWNEYNDMLKEENNFFSTQYKPNLNFSRPERYHYELTNDIDLDVYPWNEIGWYPMTKVKERPMSYDDTFQQIRDTIWYYRGIESNNAYRTYNSIGEHTGFTDGVSTLGDGNKWRYGVEQYHVKGFMGVLNGNDFSIKNLLLKEWNKLERIGLFDTISGGTVENLVIDDVVVDVDYYRGNQIPDERNITLGILANTIQATSNINKVSINGLSFIKDYRPDVRGARFLVSGFMHEGRKLNNLNGSENQQASITNSSVLLDSFITNVDTEDSYQGHFTPFINMGRNAKIDKVYVAVSQRATDARGKLIPGIHGDRVFVRESLGSRRALNILNTYYNSEVANANSGDNEATVKDVIELYGRSSEAMKLQATYVGWDFKNVWDSNGMDYPKFKPYDPNYIPPSYAREYTVLTKLDGLWAKVISNNIKKTIREVFLKSYSKKSDLSLETTKAVTPNVTTTIDKFEALAFSYDNPLIHEVLVRTGLERLRGQSDSEKVLNREHLVMTSIDEVKPSVETTEKSLGAFYNGITIESISKNSILVKINDDRVKSIHYLDNIISLSGEPFVIIDLDPSVFNKGENELHIIAKGEDEDTLLTKTMMVNIGELGRLQGSFILADNKQYRVLSNESGLLTLDRELEDDIGAVKDGFKNSIVSYKGDLITTINNNSPDEINRFNQGDSIKEELIFNGNYEEVETLVKAIRSSKSNNLINFNNEFRSETTNVITEHLDGDGYAVPNTRSELTTGDYQKISNIDNGEKVFVQYDNISSRHSPSVQFNFDLIEYVERKMGAQIPRNTREEKMEWIRESIDGGINHNFLVESGRINFGIPIPSNFHALYVLSSDSSIKLIQKGVPIDPKDISDDGILRISMKVSINSFDKYLAVEYAELSFKVNIVNDIFITEMNQVFIPEEDDSNNFVGGSSK